MKDEVLSQIKEDDMAPFYKVLCAEFGWTPDSSWLASMQESNTIELNELTLKLENAETSEGESEIREVCRFAGLSAVHCYVPLSGILGSSQLLHAHRREGRSSRCI
jgi:hypothetical protein